MGTYPQPLIYMAVVCEELVYQNHGNLFASDIQAYAIFA